MVFLRDSTFKGKFLSEAVSLIQKFSGETIVVKYGGSALSDIEKIRSFAQDVVLLKSCGIDVIIVHGAGGNVDSILSKLNVQRKVVDGVSIATKENIDLVEMILSGHINKLIVQEINKAGGVALGFSGKDGSMIMAQKMRKTKRETDSNIERIVDFGNLGLPHKVNTEMFEILDESPVIPVISPVGFDENGTTYTMNADDVAGAIASALNANRLVLMTENGGLQGEDGSDISSLSYLEAEGLKKSKLFKGVILPKLEVCLKALKSGVFAAHLVNLHEEHGILLELLTKNRVGTLIYNTEATFNFGDIEFDDC